jgi:hypothetical protein
MAFTTSYMGGNSVDVDLYVQRVDLFDISRKTCRVNRHIDCLKPVNAIVAV